MGLSRPAGLWRVEWSGTSWTETATVLQWCSFVGAGEGDLRGISDGNQRATQVQLPSDLAWLSHTGLCSQWNAREWSCQYQVQVPLNHHLNDQVPLTAGLTGGGLCHKSRVSLNLTPLELWEDNFTALHQCYKNVALESYQTSRQGVNLCQPHSGWHLSPWGIGTVLPSEPGRGKTAEAQSLPRRIVQGVQLGHPSIHWQAH